MRYAEIQQHPETGLLPVAGVAALAVAGTAIYRKLHQQVDPRLREASLLPYAEDIASCIMRDNEAVVVGGLPIDAFNASDSVIDVEAKTITVSESFDSHLIRDNGSVRDYDIMVLPKDKQGRYHRLSDERQLMLKTRLVAAAAGRGMRNQEPHAIMSVFSFDDHNSLFHSSTIADEDGQLSLQQGFVKEELPEDSMQPWDLVLPNDTTIQVLSPWEQYWRSMVRFSSGPKVKDLDKLSVMHAKLRGEDQQLNELGNGELARTYGVFLEKMLAGNSVFALTQELLLPDHNWAQLKQLGLLATARTVMATGQKSQAIQRIVQGTPKVFDMFVGSK